MASNIIPPQTKTLLNLAAVAAAPPSQWMEMTGFVVCTFTIRVTSTVSLTAGQLVIRGTSYAPQDVGAPAVITFAAIDAGAGFTMSGTTGVLAVAPATGTVSASFTSFSFPKFIQAEWLGGTGGGTVTINVTAAGW